MRRPDPVAAARRAAGAALRAAGSAAARRRGAPRDDLRAADDPRGLTRGPSIDVTFDGRPVPAFTGETLGAALLAAGVRTLRESRFDGTPRGLLCGIGACHDCLVVVDGGGPVRACVTPVADGMRAATHRPGGPGFDPAGVDLRGLDGGSA